MQFHFILRDGSKHTIGDSVIPIECFRCGLCCRRYQPQLTREEIQNMAERLEVPTEDFISRYIQITIVGYLLRQTKNGCVFLAWNTHRTRTGCRIHSFRPEACRNWTASFSRPECREGLLKLRTADKILLPNELYSSSKKMKKLYSALVSDNHKGV
jgi:Fe-S-cluster containining protein